MRELVNHGACTSFRTESGDQGPYEGLLPPNDQLNGQARSAKF